MKIKKKLKEKLIKELLELRNSRNKIENFTNNFVLNFAYRHSFISKLLEGYKSKSLNDKITLEVASSYYLSSLVTCWETYFRDIFVFVCDIDVKIQDKIKLILEEKNILLDKIEEQNISIGEFMSKQYNFQDLSQLTEALNYIFDEEFDNISDYVYLAMNREDYFSNINFLMYWYYKDKENFGKNIDETIQKIFEIRHKVTHDANYRFKINSEFMTKVDDCMFLIPQFISQLICEKYNLERRMAKLDKDKNLIIGREKEEGAVPIIFTIKDLDAEYYIEEE